MSSKSQDLYWDQTDRVRHFEPARAFEQIHDILGRKWHLRIVYHLLENESLGFSQLKESVADISSKMLSESLSSLEEHGLVDRQIVNEQPVRVEYSLTESGRALEPTIESLIEWDAVHDDPSEA
jgi:DNA-binding HxlR family transcriptional regulator